MNGALGLFLSAFLAATILPFSSEAVLAALYAVEPRDALLLWGVATLGNTLGAMVNWVLGRFCLHWRARPWFPFKADKLTRAEVWFRRYGVWSLLLAWVPVAGDPLTFVAGLLRVNFILFCVLVAAGKGGRYAVVMGVAQGLL